MKIVLSKCYGGFGLSHEAKMKIFEKSGIEVFPYILSVNWEGELYHYSKYSPEKVEGPLLADVVYFQKEPPFEEFDTEFSEEPSYDEVYFDLRELDRTDKDLISTVEELGKRANTRFSNLKIVEIPDGASYEISEYDGYETAHYGFQIGTA